MLPLTRKRQARTDAHAPDWTAAFGRDAPLQVDLGCGRGYFAIDRARQRPDLHQIALDTKRKWIGQIRLQAQREGLPNLRAIHCDVSVDLPLLFEPQSVSGFTIHHPDPWWKKRHRKRRLVRSEFIEHLVDTLVDDGFLFIQTDVPDLADEIAQIVRSCTALNEVDAQMILDGPLDGIQSHRARKCAQLGIPVRRVAFVRPGPKGPAG